jgi:DHA2 family multidrug resistance protein
VNHAELVTRVTPFDPLLDGFVMPNGVSVANGGAAALAYVNQLATTQAQMIAYLDDFKLMAFVTLACLPMLLLLQKRSNGPAAAAPPGPPAAAHAE